MDLDPRLLRYFIAVAEERHFSRAAERLHMSQPPLSYAIRQLETGLGVVLLQRTSRSVSLTDAGRVFYREALALLRQADDVCTLVRRVDAGLRGRLRIGFVGSMQYRGLPDLVRHMREALPEVEHVLLEMNSHAQIEAVRRGELDIALIHANPVPDGLICRDIVSEPFNVCLPTGHRLAGASTVQLADLAHEEFVLFARAVSPSYYETVLSLCVAAGFVPPIRHEVRHWLGVIALVANGLGVAVVPACLARSGLHGVQFLDFSHTARSICQLVAPDAHATPLQRRARELVQAHFGTPGSTPPPGA